MRSARAEARDRRGCTAATSAPSPTSRSRAPRCGSRCGCGASGATFSGVLVPPSSSRSPHHGYGEHTGWLRCKLPSEWRSVAQQELACCRSSARQLAHRPCCDSWDRASGRPSRRPEYLASMTGRSSGHHDGTVLVDLERRRVIDLLQDREAETLAARLRDHPGVEIVSRDRAEAFTEGAPARLRRCRLSIAGTYSRTSATRWSACRTTTEPHSPTEAVLAPPASAPVSAARSVVPAGEEPADPDAVAPSRQAAQAARQTVYDRIHELRDGSVAPRHQL
jgi:hypothetical protein